MHGDSPRRDALATPDLAACRSPGRPPRRRLGVHGRARGARLRRRRRRGRRPGRARAHGAAGLAAPLMGLAADRFPRRDVLLAATLARRCCSPRPRWLSRDAPFALLLVLAALFTVAAAAHKPAQAALLPHLAPDRDRQAAANALWSGDRQRRVHRRRDRRRPARRPLRRRRRVRGAAVLASAARRRCSPWIAPRPARPRVSPGGPDALAPRRSRACGSSRATPGCGCSSASCPRARSSRAWSTCSSSSPRCGSSTSATRASAGSTPPGASAASRAARRAHAASRAAGWPRAAGGRPADRAPARRARRRSRFRSPRSPLLTRARDRLLARRGRRPDAAAAPRPRRRRARAFAVVESSYWLTTAPARCSRRFVALAGPRGALRSSAPRCRSSCSPAACARRPAPAATGARPAAA